MRFHPNRVFAGLGLMLALGVVGALAYSTSLPIWAVYLLAVSAAAFLLCGYDKSIAGGSATRVPENVLLAAAFVGGTLGLLLGMGLFRHKTKKRSFQLYLGLVIVAQVALAYFVGTNLLQVELPSLN